LNQGRTVIQSIQAIAGAIPGIIRGINLLENQIKTVLANQEKIMSELDDANAAMVALTTAVSAGVAEITGLVNKIVALLGAPAGVDPAAVETLATQMKAQAEAINAAVASAKTASGV
jgi:hypothetical protein